MIHHRSFASLAAICALLMPPRPATAQTTVDNAPSAATQVQAGATNSLTSFAPFWSEAQGYDSTLILKNSGKKGISAHVAVLDTTGQQIGASDIIIDGQSGARVSIASLLPPGDQAQGALIIQWSGSAISSNVSGSVFLMTPGGGVSSLPLQGGLRYDSQNAMSLQWWLPNDTTDAELALFNAGTETIEVAPTAAVNGEDLALPHIVLQSHSDSVASLRALLTQVQAQNISTGSLKLTYTGPVHGLLPSLVISDTDSAFALAPTANALHNKSSTAQTQWLFPEVGISTVKTSADGVTLPTIRSFVLLSNSTSAVLAPQISAYSLKGSAGSVANAVAMDPLQPNETRIVDLTQTGVKFPPGTTRTALQVSHQGLPGDLGITVLSYDEATQIAGTSRGTLNASTSSAISYWDLSKSSGQMLTVGAQKGGSAKVNLYYQSASGIQSYTLPSAVSVASGAEATIDLAQTVRAHIPDQNGTLIPTGISSGIASLTVGSGASDSSSADSGALCSTQCAGTAVPAMIASSSNLSFTPSQALHVVALCEAPPAPPAANCFAQLKYRTAKTVATHAFWWIQDSAGSQYIIDGGPQHPGCSGGCGFLEDWITPPPTGHYTEDNLSAGTWFNSGTSSSVCGQVNALENYARTWNQNGTNYSPLGPNSNSFAHYCGTAAGFSVSSPPRAVGW